MSYDFIIIDSITCESIVEVMHYDEGNPNGEALWNLQTISANRIANKMEGLFAVTSETKVLIEKKYCNDNFPISLSCLLGACEKIEIISKDEIDSIIKACSFLSWKKKGFCVLTGNSLLKSKLIPLELEVYDLSQVNELVKKL